MGSSVSKYLAAGWWALAEQALAVYFTNSDYDITIDQPFTIKWTEADGPVTITLKNATDPTDLKTMTTIDSNDANSSFTWTPSDNLPSLDSITYVPEISDGSSTNYSPTWELGDDSYVFPPVATVISSVVVMPTVGGTSTIITTVTSLESRTTSTHLTSSKASDRIQTQTASDSTASPPASASGVKGAPHTHSQNLSAGAEAGIGIGVTAFILILVILIYIFLRRRRMETERSARDVDNIGPDTSQVPGKAELPTAANKHEMMAEDSMAQSVPVQQPPGLPGEAILRSDRSSPDQNLPTSTHFELEANPLRQRSEVSTPAATQPPKAFTDRFSLSFTEEHLREPPNTANVKTPVPPPIMVSDTAQETDQSERPFQTPAPAAEGDDIRRLELEQARLEDAIRESERLIQLREEKERVTKQLDALRR